MRERYSLRANEILLERFESKLRRLWVGVGVGVGGEEEEGEGEDGKGRFSYSRRR